MSTLLLDGVCARTAYALGLPWITSSRDLEVSEVVWVKEVELAGFFRRWES